MEKLQEPSCMLSAGKQRCEKLPNVHKKSSPTSLELRTAHEAAIHLPKNDPSRMASRRQNSRRLLNIARTELDIQKAHDAAVHIHQNDPSNRDISGQQHFLLRNLYNNHRNKFNKGSHRIRHSESR